MFGSIPSIPIFRSIQSIIRRLSRLIALFLVSLRPGYSHYMPGVFPLNRPSIPRISVFLLVPTIQWILSDTPCVAGYPRTSTVGRPAQSLTTPLIGEYSPQNGRTQPQGSLAGGEGWRALESL